MIQYTCVMSQQIIVESDEYGKTLQLLKHQFSQRLLIEYITTPMVWIVDFMYFLDDETQSWHEDDNDGYVESKLIYLCNLCVKCIRLWMFKHPLTFNFDTVVFGKEYEDSNNWIIWSLRTYDTMLMRNCLSCRVYFIYIMIFNMLG